MKDSDVLENVIVPADDQCAVCLTSVSHELPVLSDWLAYAVCGSSASKVLI